MEEENNNIPNKVVEEGKKIAKQALKDGAKKASKKIIAWVVPVIGWIALILIAIGCLNLIVYEIRSFFKGKTVSINPDELSSTASVQMQELITFNENGGYKLNEDYANDLIEELESKSIDTEKLRFITPNGTNMLEKYLEIELGMMLPKTNKTGDFDGLVTIERIKFNGTIVKLKYEKYDTFKNNPSEDCFSIDPDTFKILILGGSTYTTYKDLNGNAVTGIQTEGDQGAKIEEIDYQQLIQGYGVPFDFLLTLHSFSQNINFMNSVINKILESEEPIVLSYVESSVTQITKKSYTGKEEVYEQVITTFVSGDKNYGNKNTIEENDVNNENIADYKNKYNITQLDLTWAEKTTVTTMGFLNLKKADTWLKTVEKKADNQSTGGMPSAEDNNDISKKSPQVVETKSGDHPRILKIETIKSRSLNATEQIIQTVSSQSNTLVDLENKIKVDDFVKLIKSYPKVKNNLETAPSNIFSLLEEQENTQTLAKVMRYVLYKLTGIKYGVTEDDLKYILDESFLDMSGLTGESIEEKIWFTMLSMGYSKEAIAGLLGNLYWESGGLASNMLEAGRLSGYTSETYTDAVDNGTYTNFVHDGVGYGLAQWTWWSRKKGLYLFAQSQGVSIADEDLQIHYLLGELGHSEYASGYATIELCNRGKGYSPDDWKNATTVAEAALAFCWTYENPRNSS